MSGVITKKFSIITTIFLLISFSMQIVLGNNVGSNEPITTEAVNPEIYNDCIIIIFGKCNEVTGPLLWRFGLYLNFFKKDFTINAKGEFDETINIMIRGGGNFKFIWGKEIINIELKGATGILFWGGKSIIVENTHIIVRCQAEIAYLNY